MIKIANVKHLLITFCVVFLLQSCSTPIVRISFENIAKSDVTEFAEAELSALWGNALLKGNDENHYLFILRLDNSYTDGAFAYKMEGDNEFVLIGGDPVSIVHAVHSFLEEIGYVFDITGVTEPETFNLKAVENIDKVIKPQVRWRGIRQHVNFPMDISSYPIEEAEEYVKNLLRLRFNKICIHSYPMQWYEVRNNDSTEYAGHFFYGDRHYMYDNELLKTKVRFNDSTFCIPKAEAIYDNDEARSRFAVQWMQQLIISAKKLGLQVQFSFEPRNSSVDHTVSIVNQILYTYPEIDILELITEETGGWGASCTEEEVKETLATYFTPEIANDSIVQATIKPVQSDLNQLYSQLGIIVSAITRLQEDKDIRHQVAAIKIGIYCTMPGYSPAAYRLARLSLPQFAVTIMPSHGSAGVARNFDLIVNNKDDLEKTEIYSWIEFDGLMYLQQNAINGIEQLIDKMIALNEGEQLPSLLFNHWRTAENRVTARYAALTSLYGKLPAQQFYKDYAQQMGISNKELFADAMRKINEVDSYATVALGNIGFCWVGAWRGGGSYTWMSIENIEKALQMYLDAGEMFTDLLSGTQSPAGKSLLTFLGNRTLASVLYLKAFREAAEIQTIQKDDDGEISDEDKQKAIEICNHALLVFDQYIETYAMLLPDRGGEGTLVSVWNAPIKGLKVLRNQFGGVALEEIPHSDKPVDAPPLPIFYENEK